MGLDQHRAQITADWLDTDSGEVSRARVAPADRGGVRRFLERFAGRELEVALEATTGWRFVVEELQRAGGDGASGRAGRDRGAARHQEARQERPRRRAASARAGDGRATAGIVDPARAPPRPARAGPVAAFAGGAARRVAAAHPGRARSPRVPAATQPDDRRRPRVAPRRGAGRARPATARRASTVAAAMIDALDGQLAPIDKQLRSYARRQRGCRALMGQFGVGEMTAVTILAELGDARRFSSSRDAVRYAGLDITVHQSDRRRSAGHLSRQGPPALRWALFEAALCASRSGSPDHDYYRQTAERAGSTAAGLAVARKLLKRSYHTLRELGEEALTPA